MFASVPAEKLSIWSHQNFSYYLTFFLTLSFFQVGMIDPAIIQRMLMAKEGYQLRNQYLIVAAFDPVFRILIILIGLSGLVLYPNITATDVVPHMINELFSTGTRGLVIAGLLAVIMSTADSYLHVAGLAFVNDVLQPIIGERKRLNMLKWAQYATFLIGILSLLIGLHNPTGIIDWVFITMELVGPVLMFPLIAGVMGLKTDQRIFIIATIGTILSFGGSKLYLPKAIAHFSLLFSILVNGILFFGLHIIKFKGLVILSSTVENRPPIRWAPTRQGFYDSIKLYVPTFSKVIKYSQKKVQQYGAPDVLFGIFCCISFTLPYFMWASSLGQFPHLMLHLRLIGATLCDLLIVKEKWPRSMLLYFPTFWHLTLLYCIPFISTVMFLLTKSSTEWLINVAITIMFLIVLVDWFTFFILTTLGIALGVLFYRGMIGPISLQFDFTTGYLLIYQSIFATLIGLLFARRKEQRITQERSRLKGEGETQQANFLQAVTEPASHSKSFAVHPSRKATHHHSKATAHAR